MKKFLSLVLALVMTMSLVTVSAGAKDFTDADKITYDEAVAVVSAIGVVDGYTDGNFNPTNVLTRQAAAKIICNLILGPTTASALTADTAPYKDVPAGGEFAGYIAYCKQQNIISGYGDGTFKPGATLTGYAFMKMLLGALGYDATIEGYVGDNWTVNVAKQALGIDLDDGYAGTFVGSKAVTREEACLYAFNTLEATMVEYDAKTSVNVSGVEVQVGGSDAKDMEQPAGVKSYTGDKDDDTLQFCEKYFEDLKKDEGNDDFGRPANTWKIKSTEVGTWVDQGDLVETWTAKVTKAKLYNALGKTVVDDLKDGDSEMAYWFDGEETSVKKGDIADFADKNNTAKINGDKDTGNGALTEVYVDDDNNVTLVVINTYVFQATEDYSSSKEQVKIAAVGDTDIALDDYTLDGDDFDIKDIKEDDYILVNATKISDSKKYEVQEIAVAETASGEVDAYSDGDDVTIDGTTYEYAVTTKDDGVKSEIQATGGTTTLVLDQYGYIIAVDDTVISGNYVFINDTDSFLGGAVDAYAYFSDGTEGEIVLKKVAGETGTSAKMAARGWYTYSTDSSDKYTLTAVTGSYKTVDNLDEKTQTFVEKFDGKSILSNGKASLTKIGGVSVKANEKTVFVIVDEDGDVDVYTGISNAPDIDVAEGNDSDITIGYVYKKSDNYATYVFIDVEDAKASVDATTEDDTYIFLTKLDSTKDNGTDTYYVYKAIVDGVETKVETNDKYDTMKLYTKVRIENGTERIDSMSELAVEKTDETYHKEDDLSNAEVKYSNGILTIGEETFVVNSDSQLNLVLDYRQKTDNKDRDVQDMMSDDGAKYEVDGNISGSTLKSILSGYKVSGYYYIVTEDDYPKNETLDYLFLYVDAAEPIDASDEDEKPSVDVDEAKAEAEKLVADYLASVEVTSVEVTADAKKASDVKAAVVEALPESENVTATVTVTSYTQPSSEGDVASATVTVKAAATVDGQTASASVSFPVSVEVVAAAASDGE